MNDNRAQPDGRIVSCYVCHLEVPDAGDLSVQGQDADPESAIFKGSARTIPQTAGCSATPV